MPDLICAGGLKKSVRYFVLDLTIGLILFVEYVEMSNNGKNIKVSERSIEIAYKRYLADSAPGFILIAIFIYMFHKCIEMDFDLQTNIFFYFLLFLLSTPLGLAVNAVSYLCLDKFVHFIEKCYVKNLQKIESMEERPFWIKNIWKIFWEILLITAVKDEFLYNKCKNFFGDITDPKNWISVTRDIVRIMDIYHHEIYHAHEHESGAHIFLRSVAFIIIFFLPLHIFHILQIEYFNSSKNICLAILVIILLLLFSAWVSYYYHLAMLCDAYILCQKNKKYKDVDRITECLIQDKQAMSPIE